MYDLLSQYLTTKTGIAPETLAACCHYFKPQRVKKYAFLLRAGEVCRFNLFVNRGCIRLFTLDETGRELTRYFAFEGKFGTALSSLIEQAPAWEYIQALEPSEVLTISRQDFFHLVDTVPEINALYRDILEMAYITSQKRIYGLQGQSALERLRWLLDYQPGILNRLSSRVIASYLGVTPYTLSRLKAEL